MSCVPANHRRRFVAGCAIGWLGVAVMMATTWLPDLIRPGILGLSLVAAIGILAAARSWERRLRKAFLPSIGWAPWCFRISAAMGLIAASLTCLAQMHQSHVPGTAVIHTRGTMRCDHMVDDPQGGVRECGFEEQIRSQGFGWMSGGPSWKTECSRFHPAGRPSDPGWNVDLESNKLRREKDGTEVSLDGPGLATVLVDLSNRPLEPENRQAMERFLESSSDELRHGMPLSESSFLVATDHDPWGKFTFDIEPSHRATVLSPWWPWGVCGIAWLMMVASVHFSAGATMGENVAPRRCA